MYGSAGASWDASDYIVATYIGSALVLVSVR